MFGNDVLFMQRFLKSLGFYEGELDGNFSPVTIPRQSRGL